MLWYLDFIILWIINSGYISFCTSAPFWIELWTVLPLISSQHPGSGAPTLQSDAQGLVLPFISNLQDDGDCSLGNCMLFIWWSAPVSPWGNIPALLLSTASAGGFESWLWYFPAAGWFGRWTSRCTVGDYHFLGKRNWEEMWDWYHYLERYDDKGEYWLRGMWLNRMFINLYRFWRLHLIIWMGL